jgi:hypothetical protein
MRLAGERKERGTIMVTPNDPRSRLQFSSFGVAGEEWNRWRFATTTDMRAALRDLKMRPYSQRRLLCRLLRRAASQANRTVSVVPPVESHPTTTC